MGVGVRPDSATGYVQLRQYSKQCARACAGGYRTTGFLRGKEAEACDQFCEKDL
jgi:hypothetical protein